MGIVTAVAVSVNSQKYGEAAERRLEAAMAAEVQKCLDEGLSTAEEHSAVLKARMMEAHDRVLREIAEGR